MPVIDYDWLDRIQAESQVWRRAFPELSSRYVGGEGDNPEALIIGEAPGAQEDIRGRPFVGAAGVILRELMAIAGLKAGQAHVFRDGPYNCWLTNTVKFRPPGNRNPTHEEIEVAKPYLAEEWGAVGKPRLIIPVGSIALRAVTGKNLSILRTAGKCHAYTARDGTELSIWPMVHPAFGMRNPAVQDLLEADWEKLARWRAKN